MAKKNKPTTPERLNITLTPEQTEKLNTYIIKTAEQQGRIPAGIKTKIVRIALDDWLKRNENNFNIDWSKH